MISVENMMRQPPKKVQEAFDRLAGPEMSESSVLCSDLMLSCAQFVEDHWTQLRYAARAEGQDHIARLRRQG
jgi:hypothetical protein